MLGLMALLGSAACANTRRDPASWMAAAGGSAGVAGPSSGAGEAGEGGAPEQPSPITECNRYCEALPYRLPAALCEDWNRPGWEPQFCGLGNRSCADYCDTLYKTVSPECAVTLPPVVRCVAPTYSSLAAVAPFDECWLRECRDQLYTMTSACYGLREKLADARARWEQSSVVEYRLLYDAGAPEKVEVLVRAGSEPVVTPPGTVAWTVPKLFDEVERYLNEPGVAPDAIYDEQLGYVVRLARQQGCDSTGQGVEGVEVEPL